MTAGTEGLRRANTGAVLRALRRLGPSTRVELARGATPVRMVRLDGQPFADRLVRKFDLPVRGWRGAHGRQ